MRHFLLLICLFLTFQISAQQDAQFSQYMFNKLYWNPAVAGLSTEYNHLTVVHRSQWAGYDPTYNDGKAPTTQNLTYSMAFPVKESHEGNHWGLGLSLVNDQIGHVNNFEATLGVAYHIQTKAGRLSMGLSGDMYGLVVNGFNLRTVQNPDALIPVGQKESQSKADINTGIFFNSTKYYVGIGLSGLLKSEFNLTPDNDETSAALAIHSNLMAGYNWDLNETWTLQPSVLVKYAETDNFSFEGSILANYEEKYYGGFGFREDDAVSFLVGASITENKNLSIGYAFDWIINGVNAKEQTSHEIRLTYRMPAFLIKSPDIIRTPRYKHF